MFMMQKYFKRFTCGMALLHARSLLLTNTLGSKAHMTPSMPTACMRQMSVQILLPTDAETDCVCFCPCCLCCCLIFRIHSHDEDAGNAEDGCGFS